MKLRDTKENRFLTAIISSTINFRAKHRHVVAKIF